MSGNRRSLMKVSASQYFNLTFKTDLVSFLSLFYTHQQDNKAYHPIRCMIEDVYIKLKDSKKVNNDLGMFGIYYWRQFLVP